MDVQGLDRLEQKIERLRREYDLFLAGRRRGEPVALRDEVEREILNVTRHPWPSTVSRFRAKTLAYRFRALEGQVRHVMEQRASRRRGGGPGAGAAEPEGGEAGVLFDRACLERAVVLEGYVGRLYRAVCRLTGDAAAPALAPLRERIVGEVRRQLEEPGVLGVRFRVEAGERGPKIRGEVVREGAERERAG